MKPLSASRTLRFAAIWAALNAMLLVLDASLGVIEQHVSPLVFIIFNMLVAGAIAALRIVTTVPLQLPTYESNDPDLPPPFGGAGLAGDPHW